MVKLAVLVAVVQVKYHLLQLAGLVLLIKVMQVVDQLLLQTLVQAVVVEQVQLVQRVQVLHLAQAEQAFHHL
jgi:hypothetical protein